MEFPQILRYTEVTGKDRWPAAIFQKNEDLSE